MQNYTVIAYSHCRAHACNYCPIETCVKIAILKLQKKKNHWLTESWKVFKLQEMPENHLNFHLKDKIYYVCLLKKKVKSLDLRPSLPCMQRDALIRGVRTLPHAGWSRDSLSQDMTADIMVGIGMRRFRKVNAMIGKGSLCACANGGVGCNIIMN